MLRVLQTSSWEWDLSCVLRLVDNKLRYLCTRCHLTRLALGAITHMTTHTYTDKKKEREARRVANYGRTFELSLRQSATLFPRCECLNLIETSHISFVTYQLRRWIRNAATHEAQVVVRRRRGGVREGCGCSSVMPSKSNHRLASPFAVDSLCIFLMSLSLGLHFHVSPFEPHLT